MKPTRKIKELAGRTFLRKTISRLRLAVPLDRYPLHRGQPIKPFFIIGSGRCGTTLLRRILFSHPELCIPPETYFLHKCITRFERYNRLEWEELVQLVLSTLEYHPKFTAFNLSLRPLVNQLAKAPQEDRSLSLILDQFYRYYAREKKLTCRTWGDKTPKNTYHLDKIHRVFPRSRYIHLIRNGIDVAHSYWKSGLRPDLVFAAQEWRRAVELAQQFGKAHPNQYLELHYEDLVRSPGEVTRIVCQFLEVEYLPGMEKTSQSVAHRMGDVEELEHLQGVKSRITADSIGKGARNLSPDQLKKIKSQIGSTLEKLGYHTLQEE